MGPPQGRARGRQDQAPPAGPGAGPGGGPGRGGRGPEPGMPLDALDAGMRGRWWADRELAAKIGISEDQIKKMDAIFDQNRVALVDLEGAVRKAELTLDPLLQADQPDEARITAQIDKTAQARAELEKSHARMLLAIRRIMTPEQWGKLESEAGHQQPPGPLQPPRPQ